MAGGDDFAAGDEDAFAARIDKARPFLEAGDGRNALAILEPVTEVLVTEWLEHADTDEKRRPGLQRTAR
ncbi:hypothetical protein [Mesorhizobium sp.]|uniref:hypothetical protein n=1 Tax=Mesorhizobium sp. TaxID=1871066 RepID=UPI000FE885A0|nr:hypothetical protein [Mesorhizobium sp.]RWP23993.1 MAG: hypothetical protein EOR02_31920 [Mesorhizobium sp.]TIP10654.1 MAG: hypothetical protein E5X73_21705 [Mesorhizobium sp.]